MSQQAHDDGGDNHGLGGIPLAEAPASADTIWAMVAHIGEAERHFNDLQAGYRKLASTWLLAIFAGLGFLLSFKDEATGLAVGLKRPELAVALGLAGFVGIIVLWIVDVVVYHRLLLAYFRSGLLLERRNSWLPQIRGAMKGSPATWSATFFYVALATAAAATPLALVAVSSASWSRTALVAALFVATADFAVLVVTHNMRRRVKAQR